MLRAIKIINQYQDIPYFVSQAKKITTEDELEASLTVTTAHRCKGLEWDYVNLYDDFGDVAALIKKHDRNYRTFTMLYLENILEDDDQIFTEDHLRFRRKYHPYDLSNIDDELNLIYVAATRAMNTLSINGTVNSLIQYYQDILELQEAFHDGNLTQNAS